MSDNSAGSVTMSERCTTCCTTIGTTLNEGWLKFKTGCETHCTKANVLQFITCDYNVFKPVDKDGNVIPDSKMTRNMSIAAKVFAFMTFALIVIALAHGFSNFANISSTGTVTNTLTGWDAMTKLFTALGVLTLFAALQALNRSRESARLLKDAAPQQQQRRQSSDQRQPLLPVDPYSEAALDRSEASPAADGAGAVTVAAPKANAEQVKFAIAVASGENSQVTALLGQKKDSELLINAMGGTAFHVLASAVKEKAKADLVVKTLAAAAKAGAINAADKTGATPLGIAAEAQNVAGYEALVAAGADTTAQSKGKTVVKPAPAAV